MKIPFFGRKQEDQAGLHYRAFSVRGGPTGREGPSTWNQDTRSLEVTAATESPVQVFDWERYEPVKEILLMGGARLPKSGKIPLLDSHSRGSAADVLGSARGLRIAGSELLATVQFSGSSQRATEAAGLVAEGHVEDFSIGYRVNKSVWIEQGQTKTIQGRTFTGPVRVTTDWTPRELSLTAIGADELAKARSNHEGSTGMAFWSKNQENQGQGAPPQGAQPGAADELIRAERGRIAELTALCNRFDCGHLAQQFIDNGTSIEDAQRAVLQHMERQQPINPGFGPIPAGQIEIGKEGFQKRQDAMIHGIALECGARIKEPAPGSNLYRVSFQDIAVECLRAVGENPRGLPPGRLFERAMTTSDFPYITGGAQNMIVRASFEETPDTWFWVEISEGQNFNELSRVQLSEFSDFDEIPEGAEYRYGQFGEGRAVFRITTKGKLFSITRQTLVNDDKSAFASAPRAFGASCKRKIGDDVYSSLLANAAMADGITLFHADHSNLGTAGVPNVTTLTEGRKAMRMQKGLLDTAVLNIQPRYLICPASLETGVDTILNSISLDEQNSGIANPFHKALEKIVEPRLDAVSETGWYLASSANQCQHLELCFLNGQRYPYIETRPGWTVDGLEMKARIDYGVGVIDYRGLFYNEGASGE